MPGIDHLVTGKVHVTQLRPVNVEDLLRRKRIDLPGDPVRALFRGRACWSPAPAGRSDRSSRRRSPNSSRPVSRSWSARSSRCTRSASASCARSADQDRRITYNLLDICDTEMLDALIDASAADRSACRRAQARPPRRGKPAGVHPQQHHRHARAGRDLRGAQRRALRVHLDRQGDQSDQRDGRDASAPPRSRCSTSRRGRR
jgi:hypothetical protein